MFKMLNYTIYRKLVQTETNEIEWEKQKQIEKMTVNKLNVPTILISDAYSKCLLDIYN